MTLRARLDVVLNGWDVADDFSIPDYNLFLIDLEQAVKDWLIDGATSLHKE